MSATAAARSVRERGILFSAAMVRAILDGRKTQTRRLITRHHSLVNGHPWPAKEWARLDFNDAFVDPGPSPAGNPGPYLRVARPDDGTRHRVYPRMQLGDRMWVRESFSAWFSMWVRESFSAWFSFWDWYDVAPESRTHASCVNLFYRVTHQYPDDDQRWVPPMFMPRWASRLTLTLTDVRVERVQDISDSDAIREGIPDYPDCKGDCPRDDFRQLWDSLHAGRGYGWDVNPWVWVLSFRVTSPTGDPSDG
ncbi:MAG TPA: hypothetical protein VF178_10970 [Gemmatimonadaceae bacterium]